LILVDSGILSLASGDYSKQLENQVFVELLRRKLDVGYWRGNSSSEVDFVINQNRKITLLQVAYSLSDQATFERETSALKEADGKLHADRLLIVVNDGGEKDIQIAGKRILVLPAWKWLLGFT
jgi:predicted AAA+ superfamily ATPase